MTKIGRPTVTSDRVALIGRRMKAAADQAGYRTTTAMAEAMGTDDGTVSRWWTGKRQISTDKLEQYAALVGKHPSWFHLDGEGEFDEVGDRLINILDQWLHGRPLLEAFRQVTGDMTQFGARERALLAEADRRLQTRRERAKSA